MRILVFEPLKEPYVKDIEDDIHAMQEVVGGSIESIYFEPIFANVHSVIDTSAKMFGEVSVYLRVDVGTFVCGIDKH